MLANAITLFRIFLTFIVIALFGVHPHLAIPLITTVISIFALDALDGYVARKRNKTSKFGEILDTLADRIIENTFWIYFTAIGLIPIWIPIVVMARGFITDSLQRMLGYPKNGWTYALTRSRISRALSGISKMLAFTSLASVSIFKNSVLEQGSLILAAIAVSFCLLRGIPFLFIRKIP